MSSWSSSLKYGDKMGNTHPDTFFCDDVSRLKSSCKEMPEDYVPKVKSVEIYHDMKDVFGFEVIYDQDVYVGHHIGSMITPAVKCDSFELKDGEYIKQIKACHTNIMHRL